MWRAQAQAHPHRENRGGISGGRRPAAAARRGPGRDARDAARRPAPRAAPAALAARATARPSAGPAAHPARARHNKTLKKKSVWFEETIAIFGVYRI